MTNLPIYKKVLIKILNNFGQFFSDKWFILIKFYLNLNYWPDLKKPETYNEKLQWLKLNYRIPLLTQLVDKIEVKNYVSEKIGKQYIIPTIGIYNDVDEIDYSALPNKFVIKCNHNSGGIVICRDKNKFDFENSKQIISRKMKYNYFRVGREWPYKNVVPKILIEQFLDNSKDDLCDYKFYCFGGEPKVLLICNGRSTGHTSFDYYDMDFNHLPFTQGGPNSGIIDNKPINFELMKEISSKLSYGLPHVRIDLYECKGKVYFGEMTFFDSNGFAEFNPKKWDTIFGNWLKLPK